MRAAAVVFAAALCSCGGKKTFPIALDELGPAAAMIVAVEDRGALAVSLIDPADGRGLSALPVVENFDEARVTAVVYQMPLGIDHTGSIVPSAPGEGGRPIPSGGKIFSRTAREEDSGTWQESFNLPSALAAFRSKLFPDQSGCTRFEGVSHDLGTEEPVSAVGVLSDRTALLAIGREGEYWLQNPPRPATQFFLVRTDGVEDVTTRFDPAFADQRVNAIYQHPESGEIWLTSAEIFPDRSVLNLWRGDLSAGFVRFPGTPVDGWWTRELTSAGESLFGLTDCGELDRIDPSKLTGSSTDAVSRVTIVDRAVMPKAFYNCSRLAHPSGAAHRGTIMTCGHLLAIDGDRLLAQTTDGRQARLVSIADPSVQVPIERPVMSISPVRAIVQIPSGVYAIEADTAQTTFFRLENSRWETFIEGHPSQLSITMQAHGRGFLISGSFGFVTEVQPERDDPICPTHDGIAAGLSVTQITPLAGGAYLLSGHARGTRTAVTVIRPKS